MAQRATTRRAYEVGPDPKRQRLSLVKDMQRDGRVEEQRTYRPSPFPPPGYRLAFTRPGRIELVRVESYHPDRARAL